MGGKEPLKDEARKRGEWREERTSRPEGQGHSLPASEDEDEATNKGDEPAKGFGIVPPPD